MRFVELSLGGQTAYAELAEQVQMLEMRQHVGRLSGSFHKKILKGRGYWYFAYRDLDGSMRHAYVGPDRERVQRLIERFRSEKSESLAPRTQASIALGCAPAPPRHYRIIKRLADHGFFRAGGDLIGTHAFVAFGNMLGVRWTAVEKTLDVDLAHAGKNVSLALPATIQIDVHQALVSLEMGLLPLAHFNGNLGGQYRNPKDPELRLDFVTARSRGSDAPFHVAQLNICLQPLRFIDYLLEDVTQAVVISSEGAAMVNLPSPARYAVHKLIVEQLRPLKDRVKGTKDLHQAAALACFFRQHQPELFREAWQDAYRRGPKWRKLLVQGKERILGMAPELDDDLLWSF